MRVYEVIKNNITGKTGELLKGHYAYNEVSKYLKNVRLGKLNLIFVTDSSSEKLLSGPAQKAGTVQEGMEKSDIVIKCVQADNKGRYEAEPVGMIFGYTVGK